MRYTQLKAFHAVAAHGGFSRAAAKLGLSQPALSDHVGRLERAYGVELLRRGAREVRLTELGRKLFTLTERQFEVEAEALQLLTRARRLEEGHLAIGADAAVHVLPLIARFRARHPRVTFTLSAGNSAQLVERLDRFEIDFAVVAEEQAGPAYRSTLLRTDALVAFVACRHPWSRRRRIAFADLAQASLVLREPGSATRKLIDAEMAARGLVPAERIEIEGREGAREAVAAGLGMGIVSASEFVRDPRLRLLRFADWELEMREWLVCLASRQGLHLIGAFLDLPRQRSGVEVRQPRGAS